MKKNLLLLTLALVVGILFSSCAMFGKTADRDDWGGWMTHEQYAEHQDNMADLDAKRAEVDTLVYLEGKLQAAIKNSDEPEIKKWLMVKEEVVKARANSGQTAFNSNKGLVFSSNQQTLLIYKGSDSSPFRTISFDRNEKLYMELPNGEYRSVWERNGRRKPGVEFEVRPGKVAYHDGEAIGWYCGWE